MLVVALVCLVATLRHGPGWPLAVATMAFGLGIGVQPTLAITMSVSLGFVLYLLPSRHGAVRYMAAGLVVPGLLAVVLFASRWRESIAQFKWHVESELHNSPWSRLHWFDWSLGWSRAEVYIMAIGLVVVVLPALLQAIRRHVRTPEVWTHDAALGIATSTLAVSTMFSRPPQSLHPYHLVLLAPLSLLSILAVAGRGSGRPRTLARVGLVLLGIAWIPSAAQNVLEIRGPYVEYAALDPGRAWHEIHDALPPHAVADVDNEYFVPAYQAGLSFNVLPWLPCAQHFDDDRWLVLPLDQWRAAQQQLEGRAFEVHERLWRIALVQGAKYDDRRAPRPQIARPRGDQSPPELVPRLASIALASFTSWKSCEIARAF